jgi:hypothetical protein
MKTFWTSYLVSVVILAILGAIITARGVDTPLTLPMLGAVVVPLPAIVVGIWEPKTNRKTLFGFFAALIGILLIIFLLPALSNH